MRQNFDGISRMSDVTAQTVYEKLWLESIAAFDRNIVRLDPLLKDRSLDSRKGVTLIARPDTPVCAGVKAFLEEMAAVAPGQHYYQPSELHVTVLSVIPGSMQWRQAITRLPEYRLALEKVLSRRPAFNITFKGVTASPEAVMVQGFPEDNSLQQLRDDLRKTLIAHGLGDGLDRRYKIVTAHLTAARFFRPMSDWRPVKDFLSANRTRDFGTTRVHTLQLIESDWYAAANTVKLISQYDLSAP